MGKTVSVIYDGENFKPETPLDLVPNSRYLITIENSVENELAGQGEEEGDAWSVLEKLIGTYDGPKDWSSEHDHYLYGTPKRWESLFRIKGIGEEYANLLEKAGVETTGELAQQNAPSLLKIMENVNDAEKIVRKLPTENQVKNWVEQAINFIS